MHFILYSVLILLLHDCRQMITPKTWNGSEANEPRYVRFRFRKYWLRTKELKFYRNFPFGTAQRGEQTQSIECERLTIMKKVDWSTQAAFGRDVKQIFNLILAEFMMISDWNSVDNFMSGSLFYLFCRDLPARQAL